MRHPLIGLGFAMLLVASGAHAKPEAGKQFKDWIIGCEQVNVSQEGAEPKQVEQCFVAQSVTHKESGQRLLQVLLGYNPTTQVPVLQINVNPGIGILLRAGMSLKIGQGEPTRLAYEFCGQNGCQAITDASEKLIMDMKVGTEATLTVHNGRQPVALPISLLGFTAAFNSLTD